MELPAGHPRNTGGRERWGWRGCSQPVKPGGKRLEVSRSRDSKQIRWYLPGCCKILLLFLTGNSIFRVGQTPQACLGQSSYWIRCRGPETCPRSHCEHRNWALGVVLVARNRHIIWAEGQRGQWELGIGSPTHPPTHREGEPREDIRGSHAPPSAGRATDAHAGHSRHVSNCSFLSEPQAPPRAPPHTQAHSALGTGDRTGTAREHSARVGETRAGKQKRAAPAPAQFTLPGMSPPRPLSYRRFISVS